MVLNQLPATKETLINIIVNETKLDDKYVRSLIWNMRRFGMIWTDSQHLIRDINEEK